MLIIGIAILGIFAIFVFLQPKFRLFDNKTENSGISAASTTVAQNGNESQSAPKDIKSEDKPLSTVSELTKPTSTSPPKSQPENKPVPSLLSLPLPLQVLPSCDEKQKAVYEATYQQDVENENTFHDSEINRILGLGLLDDLLSGAIDSETARHQSALQDLKANLDALVHSIAC